MFRKMISLLTAVSLMLASLPGGAWADEEKNEPETIRTIQGFGDEGWAIVDIRTVTGTRVVISPVVGDEINLEEGNRYAMFQGSTIYSKKIDLPLLRVGVSGFQSAVFMKRANGKFALKVAFRSGPNIENRLIPIKDENDLRKLREFIEHFSEIQRGEYKIGKVSGIEDGAAYPKFTEDTVTFEERKPRRPLRFRTPAQIVMKDGSKVKGEVLPVFEDDQILLETGLDTRKIRVADIDRLRFLGDKGSVAMEGAIMSGIGSAATGALVGALSAWQTDSDVKEVALYAAIVFGTIGFVTGLIRGAQSTRGSKEYVLGPVKPDGKKK